MELLPTHRSWAVQYLQKCVGIYSSGASVSVHGQKNMRAPATCHRCAPVGGQKSQENVQERSSWISETSCCATTPTTVGTVRQQVGRTVVVRLEQRTLPDNKRGSTQFGPGKRTASNTANRTQLTQSWCRGRRAHHPHLRTARSIIIVIRRARHVGNTYKLRLPGIP